MSIASLVMSSRRGSVSSIITANYDDVLEVLLNYFGFVTASVKSERYWLPSADVAVFHPHGYLPSRDGEQKSAELVLDRESFSRVVGRPELPWHQTISNILRTNSIIIIGMGGNDPNFDSLLMQVRDQHARLADRVSYMGIVINTEFETNTEAVWKNRGIFPTPVADYTNDLPNFLLSICQLAADIRRVPD
jgi:hypothetical protein